MPASMTYTRFGGPEVLERTDSDKPSPGPGEVRLAVRAAGVNPIDWKILRGYMGGTVSGRRGIGVEVAGVVDALGPGVEAFAMGDEVFGRPVGGGYAEYALASTGNLVPKPADMSWEMAGGLTIAAETAYRALNLLGVTSGETVLIHGATGAVGTVATQLAVARGATVIGTAREDNHEFLRSLGAAPVTYGEGLVQRVRTITPKVDAAFDTAGKGALPDSIELVGGTDRVITIADPDAASLGVHFTGGSEASFPLPEVFAEVLPLHNKGQLRLPIASTYPLKRAGEALAESEHGHPRGKIVIQPG